MRRSLCGLLLLVLLGLWVYPSAQTTIANNAAEMSGRIVMLADGTVARTITNLFTFNRGAAAPFAVQAGSARVVNLNADQVDGYEGLALLDLGNCQGRLTLTTAVPVTTADVTAATTVFFTPYSGFQCTVYDGVATWLARTFTELSVSIAGFAADSNFDVFLFDNAGALALDTLVWTNATTRATALTTQNGVLVRSGATTRRYLGTIRTTAAVGQTEDSGVRRFVWNYYNRVPRTLLRRETTASWTYTTAVWRQANASALNQVDTVVGWAEVAVDLTVTGMVANTLAGVSVGIAVVQDSTTVGTAATALGGTGVTAVVNSQVLLLGIARFYPAVGRHFFSWNEISTASGVSTWYGTAVFIAGDQPGGLLGYLDG